ncbi:MAG TPA: methionine adenosyltransferase [Casimicrobiaceae bacterium]|nr:methionine adenosyltransferase [Casimicrobiaceae bacterium]
MVVSTQHSEALDQDAVRELVRPHVLKVLPEGWMCDEEHFYVNPTGRFVIGGPDGDCGVTGRKIIVDTFLTADPHSRVAVETMATTNRVFLAGETRGPASVTHEQLEQVVRHAIKEIGYEQDGFHWHKAKVKIFIHPQSVDIAQGVDAKGNKDEGAGDQGIMFGFACRETERLMPAPIYYAHNILRSLSEARHSGAEPGLGPDAKSQVTLLYENGKPVRATSVVVSTQHSGDLDQEDVREIVRPHVVNTLPAGWMCPEDEFYVNPTGRFVIGGPDGDAGLTGRKIIVDTYGGAAPHGGGAFSGKDPSKVDRSAAYAARYVAKNVVAAGIARQCQVQVAYAIGVARPMNVTVYTEGTGKIPDERIAELVTAHFDLRPKGIVRMLDLLRPIYRKTAAYGHFGRDEPEFTWEKTDRAETLRAAAGIKS